MSDTKTAGPISTYTDDAAGKLSRNITTRFFASKGEIRQLGRSKPSVHWFGEIIGIVFSSNRKETVQTSSSGDVIGKMSSFQLVGEFQAVKYSTGDVLESGSAYLPNYFAEVLHATLNNKDAALNNMAFAVEVGIEVLPEEKVRGGIDVAWVVRHKARMGQAESPLNQLKRMLHSQGIATRLPAPVAATPLLIEEAVIPGDTGNVPEDGSADNSAKTAEKHKHRAKAV